MYLAQILSNIHVLTFIRIQRKFRDNSYTKTLSLLTTCTRTGTCIYHWIIPFIIINLKVVSDYLDLTTHVYVIHVYRCDGIDNCICSCFLAYYNKLLMIVGQILLKIIVHITHSTCNIKVNGQTECSISQGKIHSAQCSF